MTDIVDLIVVGFISGIGSSLGFVVVYEVFVKRFVIKIYDDIKKEVKK